MSVVCYRDGVLAADSLVTDFESGQWLGHMNKLHDSPEHGHFGAIGRAEDVDTFFGWVDAGCDLEATPALLESINAIQVVDGRVNLWTDFAWVDVTPSPYVAIGDGCQVALGAFDHGATAETAVASACKFMASCGEPIVQLKSPVDTD